MLSSCLSKLKSTVNQYPYASLTQWFQLPQLIYASDLTLVTSVKLNVWYIMIFVYVFAVSIKAKINK